MDGNFLIAILAIGTLCAVLLLAIRSKKATESRREDPEAAKSTLAEDAPNSRNT